MMVTIALVTVAISAKLKTDSPVLFKAKSVALLAIFTNILPRPWG
jgi:hypothetical protein